MKKVTLTSVSIMSALSISSSALASSTSSWTGFYGGFSAGYQDTTITNNTPILNYYGLSGTPQPDSAIGGIFAGFNYQLPHSRVVAGLEASYDTGGQSKSTALSATNFVASAKVASTYALKARLGYAANGGFLPYLQAGFVQAKTDYTLYNTGFTFLANKGEQSPSGWTAGAGFDYSIGHGLFARASYSYTELQRSTYFINQPQQGFNLNEYKVGIGFRF